MKHLRLLVFCFSIAAVATLIFAQGFSHREEVGQVVPSSPMLQARSGHSATLLQDGRVLIAGGMRRNHEFYRSAELFDPRSGKFEHTGAMNAARVGHVAVLLVSGKILVAGGWSDTGASDTAELYDPAARRFTSIARMTARRGDPTATLLKNGDVLITGGVDRNDPAGIASAEIFHPQTQAFEAVGAMHYARGYHTATLLTDGRVLIVGGRSEAGVVAPAEVYEPTSRRFTQTGSLNVARYKHTAGLLADGRVLVAGGSDERDWRGDVSSAEVWDPRTGRFNSITPLTDSRFKLPGCAAEVDQNKLLIAGGSKLVEVFDPKAGRFLRAAGQLSAPWHFMTETRLNDGRVLLAGGYADSDLATAEARIYRP